MGKMILNLGAGRNQRKDCVNVDITPYPGIVQTDLSKYPWPWEYGSIDGIYASHIIEHFQSQEKFIWECLRILKKGGFLRLTVPHPSCITSIGCMGHNRTYSYSTLDDFLATDYYMFGKAKFKTIYQRLNWWHERSPINEIKPTWIRPIIWIMDKTLSYLGNLSPRICENLWIYWVGGFRESVWKGIKR